MDKTKFYTNRRNIALLATLCCILWGSAYPSIKIGYSLFNINDIGSKLVFAGYRFALAGILVLLLESIIKKKRFNFSKKQFAQITFLGLSQTALQYIFFYIGLSYTTGVRGSIINGTGTFVSIILAHFIYKNDKLNFNKIMGCIIGFLGVVIVNLNGQSLEGNAFTFKGDGFVIISAFIFSVGAIYGKKITGNMDVMVVTGYSLSIGGIILMVLGNLVIGKGTGIKSRFLALNGIMGWMMEVMHYQLIPIMFMVTIMPGTKALITQSEI